MSKDPAFLFYPNDYIGGTMGMTFEEKGAYMELLMMQFNRGHMTSHMIGQAVGQIWENLQGKFKKDDKGLFYNERLEIEIERRKAFVGSRYNNIAGKNQYTKINGNSVGHMASHMENENIDVIKGGVGETPKLTPEERAYNFYIEEGKKAKEFTDQMSRDYVKLCYHLIEKDKDNLWKLPYILKMPTQISLNDFSKLYPKSGKNLESIILKIDSIQNTIKYHNKYINLYSTINTWINNDFKRVK